MTNIVLYGGLFFSHPSPVFTLIHFMSGEGCRLLAEKQIGTQCHVFMMHRTAFDRHIGRKR